MAVYSINTSAAREAALTAVVDRLNVRRQAQEPPLSAVTNQQFLQVSTNRMLNSYVDQETRRTLIAAMSAEDRRVLGLQLENENDLGT